MTAKSQPSADRAAVFYKRRDWVVLCVIFALIGVLFLLLPTSGGTAAVIRVDGAVTAALPLTQDQTVAIENRGFHLTVTVANGGVSVQSDCPDGICEAAGTVSRQGQTIVCLPAGVSVQIEGGNAPDGVTY